jgi:hypothetical protein
MLWGRGQEAFEKGSGLLFEGMATTWVASEATAKAPILVIREYIWKIRRVVDIADLLWWNTGTWSLYILPAAIWSRHHLPPEDLVML